MGFYRLHRAVSGIIRHTHIEGAFVLFCRIPVKGDVAVCRVIRHHGSRHIIELDILSVPDHQDIISRCEKLVAEDLCHPECHRALRCSVRKCHSAGYRDSLCRSARHLRSLIRVTVGLDTRTAVCSMTGVHGDHFIFSICCSIVIVNRMSAVDRRKIRIFPTGVHSDLPCLVHVRF